MRLARAVLIALPVVALSLAPARGASAFGGVFLDSAQQGQTQVSGHRMILSISEKRTTLWDQITYTGDPQSFAWVLPIKGTVEVGISSNAIFRRLEEEMPVMVYSARYVCSQLDCKSMERGEFAFAEPPERSEVSAITPDILGPYEVAQLSSEDPKALETWLTGHNLTIPDDIRPIISAYVAEGFNFLAVKLLPGQGI